MNVKKFIANSSREAWRQVRESLGPDAVILSNRNTEDGVEILAMANEDMTSLVVPAMAREAMPRPAPRRPAAPAALGAQSAAARLFQPPQPEVKPEPPVAEPAANFVEARVWRNRSGGQSGVAQSSAGSAAGNRQQSIMAEFDGKDYDEILCDVMTEIRSMRGVL